MTSTTMASWAFNTATSTLPQKVPRTDLSFPRVLITSSVGVISSRDEVGEAGSWIAGLGNKETTTVSSWRGSLSFFRFFVRRPSFSLVLAFFSWILDSFPFLNLVAIPKRWTNPYTSKSPKVNLKRNEYKAKPLTFFGNFNVFLDLTWRLQAKKM